jgi:DNA-binding transcriptional regulator YbjK
MPRPELHTAKGQRRRDSLVRAAAQVVAERGYAGVTHRAVAERAGVPVGTITYYFSSIGELVLAGVASNQAALAEEFETELEAHLAADHTPAEACAWLAGVLVALTVPSVLVAFEVYLNAYRDPAMCETVATSLAGFERAATTALAALGAHRPEASAPALVALVDGFLLHRVARPTPDDLAQLERAVQDLVIVALMGDEERGAWLERMTEPALPARS